MAAETKKEEKKIRVMAATFTASCGDRAKKLKDDLKAAGYEQFEMKPAEGLPGYIMVETACGSQDEAQKLIGELKGKGIRASICK